MSQNVVGLTKEGIEMALKFYQNQSEVLPPRVVAEINSDKPSMPIPFSNMASPSQAIQTEYLSTNDFHLNA